MDPKQIRAHCKNLLKQCQGARPIEEHAGVGGDPLKRFGGISDDLFHSSKRIFQHRKLGLSPLSLTNKHENRLASHWRRMNSAKDYTTIRATRIHQTQFRSVRFNL